jgi:AcrR family transcriptional regulator
MAQGSRDRRVQRTWRAVHDAFFALVVEKGYEAVTVQDILDRADVGRSTFYAHFAGKQDVLLQGLDGLRGWIAEEQRKGGADALGLGFSRAMFEHVGDQRKLYRAFVGKEGGALVERHLRRTLADLVRADLETRVTRDAAGRVPVDLLAEFTASTFMALLAWWMDQRVPVSAARVDEMYRALVIPGIENALGHAAAAGATSAPARASRG